MPIFYAIWSKSGYIVLVTFGIGARSQYHAHPELKD